MVKSCFYPHLCSIKLAEPMKKNQYGQYLLQVIEEKKREVDADTFRIIK